MNMHEKEGAALKLPRRGFLHLAAGAAALPAVSRIARKIQRSPELGEGNQDLEEVKWDPLPSALA